MIEFLNLGAVNARYQAEIDAAAERVLRGGHYILGKEVAAFEQEFAAYIGVRYAVGVANGLDALTLLISSMRRCEGDEVIVPANTFIASIFAVMQAGCTPVLVEPDEDTFNMDPAKVERAVTGRTSMIMAVHLYGLPAEMQELNALARRYGLSVIEDASHAHGAYLGDQKAGNLGDAAGFSLYPTKNLGALGDAGVITANDCALYERLLALRSYGAVSRHEFPQMGRNSRLDEVQAAILRVKLKHLDEDNALRARLAQFYLDAIRHPDIRLPQDQTGRVWHQFVLRCPDRDGLRRYLERSGIETDMHYPIPPHRQGALRPLHLPELSGTDRLAREVLSLPMNPAVTDAQAEQIVRAINRWDGKN